MKVSSVKAYNVREVEKQVPYELFGNATTMWKKKGSPMAGEDLKNFMHEYLTYKTKNAKGQGCYIVVDAAVSDTRNNPYTINSVVTTGKRKFKRVYELVNVSTNESLGMADTKEEAINLSKEIVSKMKGSLGENVKHECRIKNVVTEGEAVAFTFEYTPSQNAKIGTFLCFGHEADSF